MSIYAAFWSAIAASFAALSSAAIYLVQRRNLYELARPELILTNWTRREVSHNDRPCTILRIDNLRNIGKGSALHLYMNSFEVADDNRPTSVSSTRLMDVVPVGESVMISHDITVFWNNVSTTAESGKVLSTRIEITCYDTIGHHIHHTKYELLLSQDQNMLGGDTMAPGVHGRRYTSRESIRWRKLKHTFRR